MRLQGRPVNHGDSGGPELLPPKWTSDRKKPKGKEARVGELGAVAQCQPGDVVACEGKSGKAIYLEIAWNWPDGKAAMARIWSFRERRISLDAAGMRTISADQRVRWLGVRAR